MGFFSKVAQADIFVSFDAVQYTRQDWLNRNYIKTNRGPLMLTVPVCAKNHFDIRVCDVEIARGPWARKNMRSIELAYAKASYFEQHYAGVGAILDMYAEGGLLVDLNHDLLRYFFRALGIQKPIMRASDYDFKGEKSALVLDMCVKLGASRYLFGGEGKNYADVGAFEAAGVEPLFQEYEHPVYEQLHGAFEPRMSIIDLLMNHGPKSLEILT